MKGFIVFLLCSRAAFAADSLSGSPQRIVALSPVVAEWVTDLLGEKEALRRLVGTSEFSDYPVSLKKLPKVGPYPKIDVEGVLKLKPDLVLALDQTNREDQIEKMRRLQLPVSVLSRERFDQMGEWILKLAQLLHEPEKGLALKKRWEFEVASIEPKFKSRVFVEIQSQPLVTIGGGSFMSEALSRVGFKNVFSDLTQDYPKVSREAVMKENPDEIWILDLNGDRKAFEQSQQGWEKLELLTAVKNKKVKVIRGDDFARCSLRLLKAIKSLR